MTTKNKTIPKAKIRQLWTHIDAESWVHLLKKHYPNNKFFLAGKDVIKGLCIHPNHQDTEPSFYVQLGRGFAKCFGGTCSYYESNPISFYAQICNLDYTEALQRIQEDFKPPFIPKHAAQALEAQRRNQIMKVEIVEAAHQMMCVALNNPNDPNYAYAAVAIDWLVNTRKIPQGTLHALPIGIMPELTKLIVHILDRFHKQETMWRMAGSHPGKQPINICEDATEYLSEALRNPKITGSILFPLHVTPREIGRLKFRSPDNSGKKEFFMPADEHEDMLGLFGLGWDLYYPFLGHAQNANGYIYVTEGEIDALSMMAQYVVKGHVKVPIISAGGKGASADIESILESAGVTEIYLVGDAPHKNGPEVVKSWLEYIVELKSYIFTGWDTLPGAGDIDEAVTLHGIDKTVETLLDRDNQFQHLWMWAVNNASVQLDTILEDDIRGRVETAAEHGRYVRNRLECDYYISKIAEAYNLNAGYIRKEVIAREPTEYGYVLCCADALKQLIHTVGTITINQTRYLVVFDKKSFDNNKQYFRSIRLANESALAGELAPICGSLFQFVEEHVGRAPFLDFPDPKDPIKQVMKTLNRRLREIVADAILILTKGLPEIERCRRRSQGYHCFREPNGKIYEFIVCGTDIFQIQRDATVPNSANYTIQGCPAFEDILFDVGYTDAEKGEPWYPGGLTIPKLEEASKTDLKKLYEDLVHFYNTGFRFKHQKTTAELLAALVMGFPIMNAFSHPSLLFITGNTSSGKSSLLSTLTSLGKPGIRLLYPSKGLPNWTLAGVARKMDGASTLFALDEFEFGDTDRGNTAMRIFEMIRPMISGESTRVIAYGAKGTLNQSFCLPMIFSAIQGADRPQDLNRVILIDMPKADQHIDPVVLIKQEFDAARLNEMRVALNLGMYPHALGLAALENELQQNFPDLLAETNVKMEWRLASLLFAPLAIMKYIGKDWKEFFTRYATEHEFTINRMATVSETDSYMGTIMHSPAIEQRDFPACSLAQMLINPEQREDINTSNKGVYYDSSQKLLLFLVNQIVNFIPQHNRGKFAATQIKNLLDRHTAALTPLEIDRSKILNKVGRYLGAGIRTQDVVVLHADRWLGETTLTTSIQDTPPPLAPAEPIIQEVEQPSEGITNDEQLLPDPAEFGWKG